MKTRKFITFFLLIFVIIGYSSCDKNSVESETIQDLFNAKEVLNHFNLNKLDFQKGEYFESNVKIRSTLNEIVIFVGDDSDSFFVFQTKTAPSPPLSIDFESAQILFLRSELLVINLKDNTSYSFGWNSEEAIKYLSNFKFDNKYDGFGISSFKGYNHVDVDNITRLKTIYSSILRTEIFENYNGRADDICDWHETAQAVNLSGCDSGGEGSSSCSVNDGYGSCSTTCKSEYFACCGDYPNEGGVTQNGCKCCE